jgi:hypothetical protein
MQAIIDAYIGDDRKQPVFAFKIRPLQDDSKKEYTCIFDDLSNLRMVIPLYSMDCRKLCEVVRISVGEFFEIYTGSGLYPPSGIIELIDGKMGSSIYLSSIDKNMESLILGPYEYFISPGEKYVRFSDTHNITYAITSRDDKESNSVDIEYTDKKYPIRYYRRRNSIGASVSDRFLVQNLTDGKFYHQTCRRGGIKHTEIPRDDFESSVKACDPLYPDAGLFPLLSIWEEMHDIHIPLADEERDKIVAKFKKHIS